MFAFYADEQMTMPAAQPLPVIYNGAQSKDFVLYFGSPNRNATLTPAAGAGANVVLSPADLLAVWAPNTYYNAGDLVRPVSNNGVMYRCSVAGTSGAETPPWGTTLGGTTLSGSAVFIHNGVPFVPGGVKMALSAAGLDTAMGGGSLSLGAAVAGGAAIAVHLRVSISDATLRSDATDPSVGININNCIITTTS